MANSKRSDDEWERLSRRLTAESAVRRRLEKELRSIPNQILVAQETERRRIAAELHDGVNQILASIKFRLAHLDGKVQGEAADFVKQASSLLDRAVTEVRRISKNLRPSELDDFGLIPAMDVLVQEFRRRTRLQIDFQRRPLSKRLPPQVELAIYRIFQEALANIERHAKARRATVLLNVDAKFVTLNVTDDGIGFATQKARTENDEGGLGVTNMRDRTEALGGVFAIKSAPGKGTEIIVHVKLDK